MDYAVFSLIPYLQDTSENLMAFIFMNSRISFFLLLLLPLLFLFVIPPAVAQETDVSFTRADTLRGSITPQRAWWEVVYYDLHVTVMPEDSSISGYNKITYRVTDDPKQLQVDLQQPLQIDQIRQAGRALPFKSVGESNAYFVEVPRDLERGSLHTLSVYYQGRPKVAENPPWDGGFVWAEDSLGNNFIATANQGLGASVWWPNKDHQTAEPDSMSINITVPDEIKNVSNGRLRDTTRHENGMTTWSWFVSNPINNYNVAVNAGNYTNFGETYDGKKGPLDLSYWVLRQNLKEAKVQFQQVEPMMRCFEEWFGPYPFYQDGFKLVETPYLGMEHQSAVAYGNHYRNGYMGKDLSGTGWGLKFDFIIIHESAHEWWGNNITTKDIADMWVHEGFTSYSEGIYVECRFGEEAGAEYIRGLRNNITNDRPIIAEYGVNMEGSGDMYYKGNNMLHTIRQIVADDTLWKNILRGLQKEFYHQTVTTTQVENYMNERIDYDLSPVFDQYLRHTNIPVFEYYVSDGILYYRWQADVEGFDMPIRIRTGKGAFQFIQPVAGQWKKMAVQVSGPEEISLDKNFYVKTRQVQEKAEK